MNRSVLRAASVVALVVAGAFACTKKNAALVSEIGDGDSLDCDWFYLTCDGHPPKPMFPINDNDAVPLGTWAKERKWMTETPAMPREPEIPDGPQPKFRIMAINEAKRLRLRNVGVKGFVFAHIKAKPDGPKDKRYGIGLRPDLTEDFYLVIDEVSVTKNSPNNEGWKVATWHVMGIEAATKKLVTLGNRGGFRWCKNGHQGDLRKLGASFISCSGQRILDSLAHQPAIQAELQGRSLQQEFISALFTSTPTPPLTTGEVSRQIISIEIVQEAQRKIFKGKEMFDGQAIALLASIFRDVPQFPAWMVCGSGCCTADDDQ